MAKFSEADWELTGKYTIRALSDPEDCGDDTAGKRRKEVVVVVRANQKYRKRDEANARLIRAAPEMYRYLKDCYDRGLIDPGDRHDVAELFKKMDVD